MDVGERGTLCLCPWQLTGEGRAHTGAPHTPFPGRCSRLWWKTGVGRGRTETRLPSTWDQSAISGLELASPLRWSCASRGSQEPSWARFREVGGPPSLLPPTGSKPAPGGIARELLKNIGPPEGSQECVSSSTAKPMLPCPGTSGDHCAVPGTKDTGTAWLQAQQGAWHLVVAARVSCLLNECPSDSALPPGFPNHWH